MSVSPRVRVAAAVALAAALWIVGGHFAGFDAGLLCMAPAFAVALPLLAGRYPAEAVLVRRAGVRPRRRTTRRLVIRPPARLVPRGGLLVGHALAGRAPPA
ncbi:MAG TPA: hypothetical protein VIF57_30045 [Polyangia bacterium]|jgi:hypothetical protein